MLDHLDDLPAAIAELANAHDAHHLTVSPVRQATRCPTVARPERRSPRPACRSGYVGGFVGSDAYDGARVVPVWRDCEPQVAWSSPVVATGPGGRALVLVGTGFYSPFPAVAEPAWPQFRDNPDHTGTAQAPGAAG